LGTEVSTGWAATGFAGGPEAAAGLAGAA